MHILEIFWFKNLYLLNIKRCNFNITWEVKISLKILDLVSNFKIKWQKISISSRSLRFSEQKSRSHLEPWNFVKKSWSCIEAREGRKQNRDLVSKVKKGISSPSGSNSSWPPLGLPLMVWYTEINSSDTFWPFPKCLKIDTFCEIGHFGKEASNPKMQEKKHVKKCEPICEMTFFYLTSHSNLCLIFKKINDMPIQQIDSNFCPHNHQHQKYGSSVQVYSPELMNEWIRTLDHGFNFWEVNVWVKKWEWKLKK